MYSEPNKRQEWSEDDLVGLIGDVIDNQLQSKFLGARSILPSKIKPLLTSGAVAANGAVLAYDSSSNLVGFANESRNDANEYFAFFMGALGQ